MGMVEGTNACGADGGTTQQQRMRTEHGGSSCSSVATCQVVRTWLTIRATGRHHRKIRKHAPVSKSSEYWQRGHTTSKVARTVVGTRHLVTAMARRHTQHRAYANSVRRGV